MATEQGSSRSRTWEPAMTGELPVYLYESIKNEGTYVDVNHGVLHRFPQEALVSGRSPVVRVEGKNIGPFARISDDAELPTAQARLICETFNLRAEF